MLAELVLVIKLECYDSKYTIDYSHEQRSSNLRPTGDLCIRLSVGGSVANASAPRVSMIRLTHSNCTKKIYTFKLWSS